MRNRVSHLNRSGFTLAELLVVMAIIGIMFAIALPTLSNISSQTKLEAAANSLHAAAKFTRQYAVANKQPAYLVFHDDATDPALAFRAFAIYTINIHSRPVMQSDGYFVKDWEILPPGIIIDPDSNLSENLFEVSTDDWQGALNKNNELLIDGTSFITLGFKPSGEAASASHQIHLAEGALVDGRPQVFRPSPGKQIRFTTFGKSIIVDTLYGKATAEFSIPGEES